MGPHNVGPEWIGIMTDLSIYRDSFPLMAGGDAHWTETVIQQGHADYCQAYGHADLPPIMGRCPRCGDRVQATPSPAPEHPARLLIHLDDLNTLTRVQTALLAAVTQYPEHFSVVVDQPATIDHVAYHDATLSSVLWTQEPGMRFMRLSVRPDRHPAQRAILDAALAGLGDLASASSVDGE